MDDFHLLTARHFRYELRRGGKIFSCKFGAREVCIAPQNMSKPLFCARPLHTRLNLFVLLLRKLHCTGQ